MPSVDDSFGMDTIEVELVRDVHANATRERAQRIVRTAGSTAQGRGTLKCSGRTIRPKNHNSLC